MTTSFTSLPIVDLAPLSSECASEEDLLQLSARLHDVFATVGFAYLINAPLSFNHNDVFGMAKEFFRLPEEEKMAVAKKTFRKTNTNTYRGYFPVQPGADHQNLKAGFELGPSHRLPPSSRPSSSPFILTEPNCFPSSPQFTSAHKLESLYAELSSLSSTLLALLASSLGKNPASFTSIMRNSISTLRLLHYPGHANVTAADSADALKQELSCTPHTDCGDATPPASLLPFL
ncbi:hypothetical protein NQ176_g6560 [Zarea fungicola]|uniref:Uncharacterized protein n=1 Tax=Zarea fungicola TaxID=93591 RepID=A0ACC1N2P2_9HYPO|nr:hypothetical protein NQ176_g6560 [Lecanicillium fungicola]